MSYDPYARSGPYQTGSYTTDTSTPWALIPGGRQLGMAAKAIETGWKAGEGAIAGSTIKTGLKVAGAAAARNAAFEAGVGVAAKTAATGAAARAGLLAAGAATGPVGWGITAASIAAPFILPHIPVVGAAVNKIPLIGSQLSPKKKSTKARVIGIGGMERPNPHLSGGGGGSFLSAPSAGFTGATGMTGMTRTGGNLSEANAPQLGTDRPNYRPGRGFRR